MTTPLPRDETYSWSQDANSNEYLGTVTTTLDEGQTYQQATTTQQTQDGYGNVLTTQISDYNGTTRNYSNQYLYQNSANGSTYSGLYIYDRLLTSVLTSMSSLTLVSNTYDYYPAGAMATTSTVPFEWDSASYGTSFTYRGNVTQANSPGKTTNTYYDYTGSITSQDDNNGHGVNVATSTATNYTLPDTLSPNGSSTLQTKAAYSASFAPASVAIPGQTLYGTAASTSYDSFGRVASTTAPSQSSSTSGAVTSYTYGYASGAWTITATTPNSTGGSHWTTTTLDGLGRTAGVQTGNGSTAVSEVDTVYAPCACSPVGKMYMQTQPYLPPNSAPPATTYSYDALGRTAKVLLADGASNTQYTYQGNVTTVTDPAGNWKQYFNDAFGNLVTVIEPDPTANPVKSPQNPPQAYPVTSVPTGYLLTSYTYDQLNHLTQVSMPRSTGTQTRTFAYTSTGYTTLNLHALWLTSATNPENGTVSYTYNADGTLATKKDANNNIETYSYDTYQRLIAIPDRGQTFTYDTCPANDTFCTSNAGQLVEATFGSGVGPNSLSFQYDYTYTPAGKVAGKSLTLQSANNRSEGGVEASGTLTASYTYDNQGALTSMVYPTVENWAISPAQTFTYTLDAMERPTGLAQNYPTNYTWVSGVTYNGANQTSYGGRLYNNLLQLTAAGAMTYTYSANKNNGQITSSFDTATNETITYGYDALKRLSSAASSNQNWGETYTYDGFGNMTQMQPSGTGGAPSLSMSVNAATNQLTATGVSYDNNGNLLTGFGGMSFSHDAANRVSQVETSSGTSYYGYDSGNRRIYYRNTSGAETIYFYGADGKKLATYTYTIITYNGDPEIRLNQQSENVYFTGILVSAEGGPTATDRLGSVTYNSAGNQRYYPYGAEYSTYANTPNDTEKYATYTRDSVSGMDYAMNRYYSSQWGRFLSPDRGWRSARMGNSQTWNRYAYVGGDPANRNDPNGLDEFDADGCPDGIICVYGDDGLGGEGDGGDPCEQPGSCQCSDGTTSPWCITGTTSPPPDPEPPPPEPPPPDPQEPPPPPAPPPPPSCDQMLTRVVADYLAGHGSPLSSLSGTLVQVGESDDIDPRLFAAMAVGENGRAPNNPFGLGPNGSTPFATLSAAISAVGNTLDRYIYQWNETSVSALWSGNTWIVKRRKPWVTIQYPGYCVGVTPEGKAACQKTGNTIAAFMKSMYGNPASLAFPCDN